MKRQEQITKAATAKSRGETPYFFDAFVAGAEWADEHPHWISVEDELPEKNENVLVCGDGRVFYGCWLGGELWAIARQPLEERLDFEVTHWTALPAPPIVSKMENTEKKGGNQ